jgi:hypothetical protein
MKNSSGLPQAVGYFFGGIGETEADIPLHLAEAVSDGADNLAVIAPVQAHGNALAIERTVFAVPLLAQLLEELVQLLHRHAFHVLTSSSRQM